MNSFVKTDYFEILGGCQSFQFAPLEYISNIPEANASVISQEIELNDPAVFLDGYASPGSLIFEEIPTDTPSGVLYFASLKGFYPGTGMQTLWDFSRMMNNRFILLVKDNNDNTRLMGNNYEPMKFKFEYSSGLTPADKGGYKFTFSGNLTSPCPIYLPE